MFHNTAFFFYVCVGTPRRTEGAGLARDGQNNAAKNGLANLRVPTLTSP